MGTNENTDTPDGRPARAQRELDRLAALAKDPPGWNIPSRIGAREAEPTVDPYNVSSLN